jgi:iron complex transport system ATP-binding protein
MKPICTIHQIQVGFGNRILIRDFSTQIFPGEVVALIGRNGMGKTTLLKTIAGLYEPLSGSVTIGEKNMHSTPASERAMLASLVVTVRNALPKLTVSELVQLGRYAHQGRWSFGRADDETVALEAMQSLGISDKAQQSIQTLSDGELQKAMIARALVQKAPLMILDEPTAFLDFVAKEELLQTLVELAQREKIALLFSTHDLALADKYASRQIHILADHIALK